MLKRNMVVARDQFTVKQCYMVQKQKTDLLLIFQSSSHNVLQPAVLNTEINSIIRSFVNTKHRVLWIYLRN